MNINRVVLTGNLTIDPELRSLPSGTSVCALRLASNTRRKTPDGEWVDKPNYFDVRVWGTQGEACARFLSKGRAIALDGRLEWREFETRDGQKRQTVEIVAETVEFLPGEHRAQSEQAPGPETPSRGDEVDPSATMPQRDEDIPF